MDVPIEIEETVEDGLGVGDADNVLLDAVLEEELKLSGDEEVESRDWVDVELGGSEDVELEDVEKFEVVAELVEQLEYIPDLVLEEVEVA